MHEQPNTCLYFSTRSLYIKLLTLRQTRHLFFPPPAPPPSPAPTNLSLFLSPPPPTPFRLPLYKLHDCLKTRRHVTYCNLDSSRGECVEAGYLQLICCQQREKASAHFRQVCQSKAAPANVRSDKREAALLTSGLTNVRRRY